MYKNQVDSEIVPRLLLPITTSNDHSWTLTSQYEAMKARAHESQL